jgi:hypothetical protein
MTSRLRSNRPVNTDARASAVPCKRRRARAGYWGRWASSGTAVAADVTDATLHSKEDWE